nr:site-specific integrase [Bacillus sp. UNCCL81]
MNTPKNGKSRTIDINEELVSILQKHKIEQDKIKLLNHRVYKDNNFIFPDQNGYPLTYKTVRGHLNKYIKLVGIDKHITPHCIRHTHASLCIEAGADYKYIQERLGHSDITITMNTYGHLTKGLEEKESEKVFRLLESVIPVHSDERNSSYLDRVQVAKELKVGTTTIGDWSVALEKSGWEFKTIRYRGKDKRLYGDEDLKIITQMKTILSNDRSLTIKDVCAIVVQQRVKTSSNKSLETTDNDKEVSAETSGLFLELKEVIQKISQKIANGELNSEEIYQFKKLLTHEENKIKGYELA